MLKDVSSSEYEYLLCNAKEIYYLDSEPIYSYFLNNYKHVCNNKIKSLREEVCLFDGWSEELHYIIDKLNPFFIQSLEETFFETDMNYVSFYISGAEKNILRIMEKDEFERLHDEFMQSEETIEDSKRSWLEDQEKDPQRD